MNEEQQKSLEIAKINTDNKKEITELEKKNESVARHFAAAKVPNPIPKTSQVDFVNYVLGILNLGVQITFYVDSENLISSFKLLANREIRRPMS